MNVLGSHLHKFSFSLRGLAQNVVSHYSRAFCSSGSDVLLTAPVTVDTLESEAVAIVRLNRPQALNALSIDLCHHLCDTLQQIDKDNRFRSIVLIGKGKAFAAGADIKEMNEKTYHSVLSTDMFEDWNRVQRIRKPIIAGVSGYALGGGCELAMMCDIIVAAEQTKFGQPEIKLGTIPGMGGTQRLIRAVGKSKAMEWILTGELFDAQEALRSGLISHVVPRAELESKAISIAKKISSFSSPAVQLAKECVNRAMESTLQEGLLFERRAFHATFALPDRRHGMAAFVDKATPEWKH